MKRYFQFLALLSVALLFFSCGRSVRSDESADSYFMNDTYEQIRKMLSSENADSGSLEYNANLFRLKWHSVSSLAYGIENGIFFEALSNESILTTGDRESNLTIAISNYELLLDEFDGENEVFLYQRIGISYLKNGDYTNAAKYLKLALMEGADNSELYYYRAIIAAYHDGDAANALKFLKKVESDEVFAVKQDLIAFQAELLSQTGKIKKALKLYEEAVALAPLRFYKNYNLIPFYVENGYSWEADRFTDDAMAALSILTNEPEYLMKAYRMRIGYLELIQEPSYSYSFDLEPAYEIYGNLYYFTGHRTYIKRKISKSVDFPIQEVKQRSWDTAFYSTYEDIADFEGGSGYFVTCGVPALYNTNFMLTNYTLAETDDDPLHVWLKKLYFSSNYAVFLTATNSLSLDYSTNDEGDVTVSTNEDEEQNALDMVSLSNFTYLYDTDRCDVDGDGYYDFLIFGYEVSNLMNLTIYYPNRLESESYDFTLDKADSEIYIADVDEDGEKEIMLFGNELIFLKDD